MANSKGQSPCRRLCVMDETRGYCTGCGRTLAEIGGWLNKSEQERIIINQHAAARLRQERSATTASMTPLRPKQAAQS